jgi:glycosyltransferase involved in cell wall biosynthesis
VLIPTLAPETSSLVAMEALACGTPVIAYASGALPEIVQHGETGFLVHDAGGMAAAIAECDRIDPSYCRQVARERFSAKRMATDYLDAYRQLARA